MSTVSIRITSPQPIPPPPSVPLWQFKQSHRPLDSAQTLGSAPDVVILATGLGRFTVTKEWQLYIKDINHGMLPNNVWGLFGTAKAFCNADTDPRRNWIEGKDLGAGADPQFDKDRTCGLACHTGAVEGNYLRVTTFNGNFPPPMVINPETHPFLYFHATIIYRDGKVAPFPHGAPAWGYTRNVVLMPLVATHPILYPLSLLTRVTSYRLPYAEP